MVKYYQLLIFLTIYCLKNNCDDGEQLNFMCRSEDCKEMIGTARTIMNYKTPDSQEKLIFEHGEELTLFGFRKEKNHKIYIAKGKQGTGLVSGNMITIKSEKVREKDLTTAPPPIFIFEKLKPSQDDVSSYIFDHAFNQSLYLSSMLPETDSTSNSHDHSQNMNLNSVEISDTFTLISIFNETTDLEKISESVMSSNLAQDFNSSESLSSLRQTNSSTLDSSFNLSSLLPNSEDSKPIHVYTSAVNNSQENKQLDQSNMTEPVQSLIESNDSFYEHLNNSNTNLNKSKFANIDEKNITIKELNLTLTKHVKLDKTKVVTSNNQFETNEIHAKLERSSLNDNQINETKVIQVDINTNNQTNSRDVVKKNNQSLKSNKLIENVNHDILPKEDNRKLNDAFGNTDDIKLNELDEKNFNFESEHVLSKSKFATARDTVYNMVKHDNENEQDFEVIEDDIKKLEKEKQLKIFDKVKDDLRSNSFIASKPSNYKLEKKKTYHKSESSLFLLNNQKMSSDNNVNADEKVNETAKNEANKKKLHQINEQKIEHVNDNPIYENLLNYSLSSESKNSDILSLQSNELSKEQTNFNTSEVFINKFKEEAISPMMEFENESSVLSELAEQKNEINVKSNSLEKTSDAHNWMNLEILENNLNLSIDSLRTYLSPLINILPEWLKVYFVNQKISPHLFVVLMIIAISWITLFIFNISIKALREDGSLKEKLCKSQLQTFKLKAEKDTIEDELISEKMRLQNIEKDLEFKTEKLLKFEESFELIKSEKDELKRKCLQLEKDLQSATDAGLELNEMLSDFLTSQKENVDLNSRIKELCRVISKQQEAINELEKTSNELKQENSTLQESNTKLNKNLTDLLSTFETNKKLLEKLEDEHQILQVSKERLIEEYNNTQSIKDELQKKCKEMKILLNNYENEIKQVGEENELKCEEINALKEIMKEMQVNSFSNTSDAIDSPKVYDILDVTKLKRDLNIAEKKNFNYDLQLKQLVEEKANLDEKLKENEQLIKSLQEEAQEAKKEKNEVQNNLEVLTNYFNEREVKMQSELGFLQVKKEEEIKKNQSVNGYLKELEEKNENLKNQMDSIKQELMQNESYLRSQIGKAEKKAHENWIAARNLKRDLEDSRKECEYLRQKLIARTKPLSSDYSQNNETFLNDPNTMSFLLPPPPPPPPPQVTSLLPNPNDASSIHPSWTSNSTSITPPPPPPMIPNYYNYVSHQDPQLGYHSLNNSINQSMNNHHQHQSWARMSNHDLPISTAPSVSNSSPTVSHRSQDRGGTPSSHVGNYCMPPFL